MGCGEENIWRMATGDQPSQKLWPSVVEVDLLPTKTAGKTGDRQL